MDDTNIIIQPAQKRTIEEAINTDYDFKIGQIISESFAATKGLKLKFFFGLLIYMAINTVMMMIGFFIFGENGNTAYEIVCSLIYCLLITGFIVMGLNWLRSGNTKVSEIFSGFQMALPIVLLSIMMMILIMLGLLLLIIPGIYLIISYIFVYYIFLDNPHIKLWDALEASRKIAHKQWFKILALNLIFGLIIFTTLMLFSIAVILAVLTLYNTSNLILLLAVLISAIPFLIAIIWVFPAAILAHGIIYQKIFDKNNEEKINNLTNTNNVVDKSDEYNQDIIY